MTSLSAAMIRFRTGKRAGCGPTPNGCSLDEQPVLAHPLVERAVAPRVDDVETGGDDADDRAARVERAFVRRAVDADREPAHHDDPGAGERGAELARVGQAVRRRGAGADHRDARLLEHVGPLAFGEQHRGPVVDALVDRVPGPADVQRRACRAGPAIGAIAAVVAVDRARPRPARERERPRLAPVERGRGAARPAPRRARRPASASASAAAAGAPG